MLVELLAGTDEATAGAAWREIESAAAAFEDESGFRGPCEVMVASATRP